MFDRRSLSAFTLLELLIVCAVLALLGGLAIPAVTGGLSSANRTKCASNMRQIGAGILLYAADHNGMLPRTTHSTGTISGRYLNSWIHVLKPYLADYEGVRVCPADEPKRQEAILKGDFTSYVMNDALDPKGLFDEGNSYNRLHNIPRPSETMMLFILSANRAPARGWDHIHSDGWNNWSSVLEDIEPDRHLSGTRSNIASERVKGSANYLFADGHVENIPARELKARVEKGVNPAAIPLAP